MVVAEEYKIFIRGKYSKWWWNFPLKIGIDIF